MSWNRATWVLRASGLQIIRFWQRRAVLAGPRLDGLNVLDLGWGLGACGFAAACQGARVTFFDWEPRALEIVAASAREQGGPAARFDFVVGDWRQPPPFGPF